MRRAIRSRAREEGAVGVVERRACASRSGRRASVVRSDSSRRQRAIAAWSPERSTSGTRERRGTPRGACTAGARAGRSRTSRRARDASLPSAPGEEAHDRVDDDERGELAAREHVVADRELLVDVRARRARRRPRSARRRGAAPAPPASARGARLREAARRAPRAGCGAGGRRPRRARSRRPAARASSPCPGRRRTACRRPAGAGPSA